MSMIPAEFTRTRIEPDGDKIRAGHERGELPESFSVTRGTHLRIK